MGCSLNIFITPTVPLKIEVKLQDTNLFEANSGARLPFFDNLASLITETLWLAICNIM